MILSYRKDIQILRGIAVLLVVLFHLEIGGFQSGFLGVDVFFVISGYLMAQLYNPKEKKKFFKRRILRLLPTYFTITLLTIIVALFITTPNEFRQLIPQAIHASTFTSNIGFWLQNSYFSKTDFNPLLHLWSLGVEIQFYLIIPILFFLFTLNRYALLLIIVTTLILSSIVLGISPKTSFFMMPLRIWEFLIGYAVVYYFSEPPKGSSKTILLGTLALIFLLFIPLLPIEKESSSYLYGHPGLYALLISLATATILRFGIHQQIELSKIGKILETLGQYSYSIYLVHFPIIVLYLYQPFSGTILHSNSMTDTFILLILITLSSILSYHLFEKGLTKFKYIKSILIVLPILIVLTAIVGAKIQKSLFTEEEQKITSTYKDRDTYRCGKLSRILNPTALTCNLTQLNSEEIKQKILFLGDSHADSIKRVFSEEAKKLQSELYFFVPNEMLILQELSPEKVIKEALDKEIDTIVIHYSRVIKKHLSRIATLIKLAEEKSILVIYLMDIPRWERDIPKALWYNLHEGKALPKQSLADYHKVQEKEYEYLLKYESKYFKIYQTADVFCKESCPLRKDTDTDCYHLGACQDSCSLRDNMGKPLYFDSGHLTITGSRYLTKRLKSIIIESQNFKEKKAN
jgi:peptidoglycan/LPS O-acetylase OafA/YrhL